MFLLFSFFSVRRLLGSVTQCLCQLNELCSILHRLLLRSIKRDGPTHSLHVRWRPHEEKTHKTNKNHKSTTLQKQNKTKAPNQNQEKPTFFFCGRCRLRLGPDTKPGKTHTSAMDKCSMRIAATHVLTIEPCIEATPKPEKKHNCKAPGKSAKRSPTRCGNPG